MRELLFFTVGFAIACIICVYVLTCGSFLFAAICVGLTVVFLLQNWQGDGKKVGKWILIGCTAGAFWLWAFEAGYLSVARSYSNNSVDASVEITDYSYDTDYGVAADGTIVLDEEKFSVRVYLPVREVLAPGDQVQGEFRLRLTVRGEESDSTYHSGEGIYLLVYGDEDAKITRAESVPTRYFAAELRSRIQKWISDIFPEDTIGFARALLLGDSSLLTYEEDTAFKVSGIRHVIAVSGLHVSILFSVVYVIAGRKRGLVALIGIPVLVLFAAVAGFTPSVMRACIMQGLMVLAMLVNKEYDPPTALAFAALSLMAINPMVITSVSFQLSVGCMIGIFLFSGKIHRFLLQEKRLGTGKGRNVKARLARWIAGSVSVSVSAMIVTTPLSAYYFGMVSIVGILSNLLVLWVISLIFYGIVAACICGIIWLPLGKLIAFFTSWLIRYVLLAAKLLSAMPLAAVYTCSIYILLWLLFTYCLLFLFLRSARRHPVVLISSIVVTLAVAVAASWIEPRQDEYRISILDVGQGQSILLQSYGKTYLVDCGGDDDLAAADTAAQMLLSQGISSIDGLILTHYDQDHTGGVNAFLSRIHTKSLYIPDIDRDNKIRKGLVSEYKDQIVLVEEQLVLNQGSMTITLFPAEDRDDDNECSMCILFQTENCDILITGDRGTDGELALLQQAQLPKLEILVVGHHGSNSSTSVQLLKQTKPAVAVISAGANNRYGHPAQQVLERLSMYRCKIYRTDRKGTIVLRG